MPSNEDFHAGERALQRRWGTASLWDAARRERLLWDHLPDWVQPRLAAAPFFFLATSDATGRCDCSFKGGGPGLVRILDARRWAFPDFDGNGAFMSLGNLRQNPQVGCLFIDFGDGARQRVNGRATLLEGEAAARLFPGQDRTVVVDVEQVVPSCARLVPTLHPPTADARGAA